MGNMKNSQTFSKLVSITRTRRYCNIFRDSESLLKTYYLFCLTMKENQLISYSSLRSSFLEIYFSTKARKDVLRAEQIRRSFEWINVQTVFLKIILQFRKQMIIYSNYFITKLCGKTNCSVSRAITLKLKARGGKPTLLHLRRVSTNTYFGNKTIKSFARYRMKGGNYFAKQKSVTELGKLYSVLFHLFRNDETVLWCDVRNSITSAK